MFLDPKPWQAVQYLQGSRFNSFSASCETQCQFLSTITGHQASALTLHINGDDAELTGIAVTFAVSQPDLVWKRQHLGYINGRFGKICVLGSPHHFAEN